MLRSDALFVFCLFVSLFSENKRITSSFKMKIIKEKEDAFLSCLARFSTKKKCCLIIYDYVNVTQPFTSFMFEWRGVCVLILGRVRKTKSFSIRMFS